MRAEIITIGDELCRGEIVNTNASWLAAALWEQHVTVTHMHSCLDVAEDMAQLVQVASDRSDLVVLSGGLGPTSDDLTVDMLAELVGVQAIVHEPSAEHMRKRFAAAGLALVANSCRQVRAPAGARVYANSVGLAPGFEVTRGSAKVIALPGPPRELKAIFADHLRDRISKLRLARGETLEHVARRIFRIFGKGESHITAALQGLPLSEGASLHYQVKFPETLVSVVVRRKSKEAADAELTSLDMHVRERLGWLIYGTDDDSMPKSVVGELERHGHTIATAESCTGGMISALLTEVPGVSKSFTGGAVTYSNEEKTRQLGVSPAVLETHGAVSEEVVFAMAKGVRDRMGTDWGVAVSGIAGPGGGSPEKPVGTVCIAVVGPGGICKTKTFCWPWTRERIRKLAAHWALNLVRQQLGKLLEVQKA